MPSNFDDIFKAAKGDTPKPAEKPPEKPKAKAKPKTPEAESPSPKPDPWAELTPEKKEPTIRLNVDIPIALNDKLADKARELRKSKSDLVRELLKWALE